MRLEYARQGHYPGDHYPQVEPAAMLLVLAAIGLLIDRFQSHVLTLMATVWIIYEVGYRGFFCCFHQHDEFLENVNHFTTLLSIIWQYQPQYLMQLSLAVIIAAYAAILLLRRVATKSIPDAI